MVFGSVVSGRPAELPGVESMVGLFINTLPIRLRLDPTETVGELIERFQEEQAGLLPHHHLGLTQIQQLAGTGRLFDTLTVYENYPRLPSDDGTASEEELHRTVISGVDASHYPLTLVVMPGDKLRLRLDYQKAAFDEAEAQSLLDRLLHLLDAMTAELDTPVGRVQTLLPAERHQVLTGWNATDVDVPSATLPELFAAQVGRSPDATAVVFGD
ncbi:condensation domain-containing protein, partial [Streptomyces noursei]|uniref:condensation domain-containing protein n=1 Tax=Streptomyces noursei TaxID=1971 RepID=UPI0027E49A2B